MIKIVDRNLDKFFFNRITNDGHEKKKNYHAD